MTPGDIAALVDRAYLHMRPWSSAQIADTLESPQSHLLTRPNGVLIAQIVADEAEILLLATDPVAQRSGVASDLLNELLDVAALAGADRVFLEVAAKNDAARTFYAGKGFAEIGRRRAYYTLRDGEKDDALVLSRPVA